MVQHEEPYTWRDPDSGQRPIMRRFPQAVREAMHASGAASTCLPVQIDGQQWETAVFLQLAGPECKQDRRVLSHSRKPVPLGIESELIDHASAAVVMLRFEVYTDEENPFVGEVLLTPGEGSVHFEALQLLTGQPHLRWFFADQHYWLVHSQQHGLDDEAHREFQQLLDAAVRHDALIRLTGRYDARAALAEVVSNYELRGGNVSASTGPASGKAPN